MNKIPLKNKVVYLLLLAVVVVILFVFGVYQLLNAGKTATVKILVAPIDAVVEIDGKVYSTETTFRIEPGEYPVKISMDGFKTFENTLEAKENETTYLYTYLAENNGDNFYSSHSADAGRAQRIDDFLAKLNQESYTNDDPIFNFTPYQNYEAGFVVYSKREEDSEKINLSVYLYTCDEDEVEKLKSSALKYLTDRNINPENYSISYNHC